MAVLFLATLRGFGDPAVKEDHNEASPFLFHDTSRGFVFSGSHKSLACVIWRKLDKIAG